MKSFIATAALVAATAASRLSIRDELYDRNATFIVNEPSAKVVNRCSYPVYLWSIAKEEGCPAGEGVVLKPGDFYHENYVREVEGGISIKLSKFETCGGKDISQLEYKIVETGDYKGNYLDMSFVDCTGSLEDCPGRTDGFYLKSGNAGGLYTSAVDNEHCPVFSVYNAEEAAKVSYINWDDVQTKWCNTEANLELYLCGGDAPSADDDATAPVSSAAPSSEIESSSAAPTSSSSSKEAPAPSTTEDAFVVAAAAEVTKAPVAPAAPAVKTEVVYVTEYVNKRHAHGRRHQHFHA